LAAWWRNFLRNFWLVIDLLLLHRPGNPAFRPDFTDRA